MTTILEALKFVKGAVAKKDYEAALTHFQIKGGKVIGYNGAISLCSPIPIDLDVVPRAVPFVKAINACQDSVSLSVTATGRLSIRSGPFKSFVECMPLEEFPVIEPSGTYTPLTGIDFLSALKSVEEFIGKDASRPWARGVLFRGQSLYATNNIILIQYWMPVLFPVEINLPQEAVRELLRIGVAPNGMWLNNNTVTFDYGENCWLQSRLFPSDWPDVSRILDRESTQVPMTDEFFKVLERLSPFVDKVEAIYLRPGVLTTALDEAVSTSEEMHIADDGCYNIFQVRALEGIAQTIDWTQYPAPCVFYGEGLRGALSGMRPR